MFNNNENNLISIDDVIFRAKSRGVDFGKGDPRERLRYLTKIGLLPHAHRKSFNGQPPNGAYPEYVLELLVEIDRKTKAGKSIQELKKEKEREILIEVPPTSISFPASRAPQAEIEIPQVLGQAKRDETRFQWSEKKPEIKIEKIPFEKIAGVLKIIFFVLIFGGIIFFLITSEEIQEDLYSYFLKGSRAISLLPSLVSFSWFQKLAQAPEALLDEGQEFLQLSRPEPYLTINAPTDINGPLNVKEKITTPALALLQDEFEAALVLAELTADRTYTFPDQSGVVCLSTGNCIGIRGEVISVGGASNRLAKFINEQEIGVSSIEDFYSGVALIIDSGGRVGIGRRDPRYPLHVTGRIQATGDICTNLAGGRCLSTLPVGGAPSGGGTTVTGVGGSGTANYLPLWTAGTTLGDSIIYQSGSNIGIGTSSPAYTLDVYGTSSVRAFIMSAGAASGYILTSDASGIGTWQPATGTLPAGTDGQTLRHNGTSWVANSFLYNSGTAIGIGTTTPLATLTLSGNAIFATTTLPQLALRYDNNNYLNFAIDSSQSLIEASKTLVFNSLTGEIKLGSNVNLFDAFGATVRGATFVSTTTDSTVRKSGELVFRASLPIFRFGVPAQTTSTNYTAVSKTFSTTDSLSSITPSQLPGTTRVYAFLINLADDIATTSSSTWRVYRPSAATTTLTFEFTGQNLSSLVTGNPHLSATTTLPNNDWRLDVKNPSADKSVRIFNIFLLTFDQIN